MLNERNIIKEIKDRIINCECKLDIEIFLSSYTDLVTEKEYINIIEWSKLYI